MSAHFHFYLCGRTAAEWLISMKKNIRIFVLFFLVSSVLCACTQKEDMQVTALSSLPRDTTQETAVQVTVPSTQYQETIDEETERINEHSVAAIQQRGTLRVAIQTQNSKMSYWVPEGIQKYADRAGQPSGYVPFLCQQLADDLGVTVEFVAYDVTEQQIEAAESNEVDLSANVWSITEERLERYTMTDNILVNGIEGDDVFLRADPENPAKALIGNEEELAVARIGAVKATVQVGNTHLQYPDAEVVPYIDNDAVLDALVSGEVDAAVFTTFDRAFADILERAIYDKQICRSNYEIVNPEIQGVGFILMKGNTDLCGYINNCLTQYRSDGLLQKLNDQSESEAKEMGII